jgi:hypothetical protein
MRGVRPTSPDVRRVAMDVFCRKTCGTMRTAKPRGPDTSTPVSSCAIGDVGPSGPTRRICTATVTKKPEHRGDRGVSRKAIAQGVPDVSALPDDLWALSLLPTRIAGAVERPVLPAPSVSREHRDKRITRAYQRRGNAFARHCEERSDEAIQTGSADAVLDCFASLAMTTW